MTKPELDALQVKLQQRILASDGGTANQWNHHWNLVGYDSKLHKDASDAITALVAERDTLRKERDEVLDFDRKSEMEAIARSEAAERERDAVRARIVAYHVETDGDWRVHRAETAQMIDVVNGLLVDVQNMDAHAANESARAGEEEVRRKLAESRLESAIQPLAPEMERLNQSLISANARAESAERERDAYKDLAKLNEMKVIACGVAATNPDRGLTRTGAYAAKWDSAQAEHVRKLREERDTLAQTAADMRRSFPYCEKHKPDGGARAVCPICALVKQSAALSSIDYLCGPPNEMEVSEYDMHWDEDAVMKRVADLRADAERYRWLRDLGGSTWRREGHSAAQVDGAIDVARGAK